MKKLLTIALAGVMCFSFGAMTACEKDKTPDPDTTLETPETPETPEDPETPVPEVPAVTDEAKQAYLLAAIQELASAKTLKLSQSGEISETLTGNGATVTNAVTYRVDYVFSATETGLDASIVAAMTEDDVTMRQEYYLIDSVLYSYDAAAQIYYAQAIGFDMEDLFELVSSPTQEELNALTAELLPVLDEYGAATETGYGYALNYDATPLLNAAIFGINMIDEETTTIGGLLDAALALMGTELTSAQLIDMIKPLGGMTVKQALDAINEQLAPYGVTLDGIKNEILSMSIVQDALIDAGMEQMLQLLQNTTIEGLLSSLGMLEMTFDQITVLILSLTGADATGITLSTLLDMVKTAIANTTLADAGITLPELDGFLVTRAALAAEAVVNDSGVEKLTASVDFSIAQTSEAGTQTFAVTSALSMEELSGEAAVIALPQGAVIQPIFSDSLDGTIGGESAILRLYSNGTGVFDLYTYDSYICYSFNYTLAPVSDLSALSMTITITEIYYYGRSYDNGDYNDYIWMLEEEDDISAFLGGTLSYTVTVNYLEGTATLPDLPITDTNA